MIAAQDATIHGEKACIAISVSSVKRGKLGNALAMMGVVGKKGSLWNGTLLVPEADQEIPIVADGILVHPLAAGIGTILARDQHQDTEIAPVQDVKGAAAHQVLTDTSLVESAMRGKETMVIGTATVIESATDADAETAETLTDAVGRIGMTTAQNLWRSTGTFQTVVAGRMSLIGLQLGGEIEVGAAIETEIENGTGKDVKRGAGIGAGSMSESVTKMML